MEPIPMAAYRRRHGDVARVRETAPPLGLGRAGLRAEHTAGERVLGDLALAWNDAVTSARVVARFAAVRVLAGGPDVAEARALLAEWEPCIRGTAEGRALAAAVRTFEPGVRYRALRAAATAATRLGHHASALSLRAMAWDVAVQARRRGAAVGAARAAARSAAAAGGGSVAARWQRLAARLERRETS